MDPTIFKNSEKLIQHVCSVGSNQKATKIEVLLYESHTLHLFEGDLKFLNSAFKWNFQSQRLPISELSVWTEYKTLKNQLKKTLLDLYRNLSKVEKPFVNFWLDGLPKSDLIELLKDFKLHADFTIAEIESIKIKTKFCFMILKHLGQKKVVTNIMVEMNKTIQFEPMAMVKIEKLCNGSIFSEGIKEYLFGHEECAQNEFKVEQNKEIKEIINYEEYAPIDIIEDGEGILDLDDAKNELLDDEKRGPPYQTGGYHNNFQQGNRYSYGYSYNYGYTRGWGKKICNLRF